MQNVHYVCDSCEGVSDVSKACDTEGCELRGRLLGECNCEMPEHLEKAEAAKKMREKKNDS